jgi:hypothetical protein
VSKRANQHFVYCKHAEDVIAVGACRECRKAKEANQAFRVKVRFKEGYHHGLGEYVSTERELITKASKVGTLRWD